MSPYLFSYQSKKDRLFITSDSAHLIYYAIMWMNKFVSDVILTWFMYAACEIRNRHYLDDVEAKYDIKQGNNFPRCENTLPFLLKLLRKMCTNTILKGELPGSLSVLHNGTHNIGVLFAKGTGHYVISFFLPPHKFWRRILITMAFQFIVPTRRSTMGYSISLALFHRCGIMVKQ